MVKLYLSVPCSYCFLGSQKWDWKGKLRQTFAGKSSCFLSFCYFSLILVFTWGHVRTPGISVLLANSSGLEKVIIRCANRESWVEVLKCIAVLLSARIVSATCQLKSLCGKKSRTKTNWKKGEIQGHICHRHAVGMTCPVAVWPPYPASPVFVIRLEQNNFYLLCFRNLFLNILW